MDLDYLIPSLAAASGSIFLMISANSFWSIWSGVEPRHMFKPFARRLHDALQGKGIRCWLDEKQMRAGDLVHQEVDRGVRLWDKLVLCASKTSLNSWWVDKEIQKALMLEERMSKEFGKPVLKIIPLDLDGFMFDSTWDNWKQQHLVQRLAPNFKGWKSSDSKFNSALEQVVQALRSDEGAREKPPTPKLGKR